VANSFYQFLCSENDSNLAAHGLDSDAGESISQENVVVYRFTKRLKFLFRMFSLHSTRQLIYELEISIAQPVSTITHRGRERIT